MSPCPADDGKPSEGAAGLRPCGSTIFYCDPLAACDVVHSKEAQHAEELQAARQEAAALRESMIESAEAHEKRVSVDDGSCELLT